MYTIERLWQFFSPSPPFSPSPSLPPLFARLLYVAGLAAKVGPGDDVYPAPPLRHRGVVWDEGLDHLADKGVPAQKEGRCWGW